MPWAVREPVLLCRHPLHRHQGPGFDAERKGPRDRMYDLGRLAESKVAKRPSAAPDVRSDKLAKLNTTHLCHGLDAEPCVFNAAFPGQPARYHRHRRCPWCCEEQMGEALAAVHGRDNLSRSLKSFWEKDKDVFHAAVARLPDDDKTFFPLRALGLPPSFASEDALAKAATTAIGRGNVTRFLNRLEKRDADLHDMALHALPDELRRAWPAVAKRKPAARKRPAAASRPDQWRDCLLCRRPCIKRSEAGQSEV